MKTMKNFGAGNETRTRDPDLGKVVLYQLSYSRRESDLLSFTFSKKCRNQNPLNPAESHVTQ